MSVYQCSGCLLLSPNLVASVAPATFLKNWGFVGQEFRWAWLGSSPSTWSATEVSVECCWSWANREHSEHLSCVWCPDGPGQKPGPHRAVDMQPAHGLHSMAICLRGSQKLTRHTELTDTANRETGGSTGEQVQDHFYQPKPLQDPRSLNETWQQPQPVTRGELSAGLSPIHRLSPSVHSFIHFTDKKTKAHRG